MADPRKSSGGPSARVAARSWDGSASRPARPCSARAAMTSRSVLLSDADPYGDDHPGADVRPHPDPTPTPVAFDAAAAFAVVEYLATRVGPRELRRRPSTRLRLMSSRGSRTSAMP